MYYINNIKKWVSGSTRQQGVQVTRHYYYHISVWLFLGSTKGSKGKRHEIWFQNPKNDDSSFDRVLPSVVDYPLSLTDRTTNYTKIIVRYPLFSKELVGSRLPVKYGPKRPRDNDFRAENVFPIFSNFSALKWHSGVPRIADRVNYETTKISKIDTKTLI